MIDIKRFEELFNLEDTAERCQKVRLEVQPVLDGILREFVDLYSDQDSTLLNYETRTYESTLKTIYSEAMNSKTAEGVRNTSVGSRDFTMLVKKVDSDLELCMLKLSFDGKKKIVRIGIETDHFYLWQAVKDKAIDRIMDGFGENIKIAFLDSPFDDVTMDKLVDTIKQLANSSKRPWLFIGIEIPFEEVGEEREIVDGLWKVWKELGKLREFYLDNSERQEKSLGIFKMFMECSDITAIQLFNHVYEVKAMPPVKLPSSRLGYREKLIVSENGQILFNVIFNYYRSNPTFCPDERLSIYVYDREQFFQGPRMLLGVGKVEWRLKKSFSQRGEKDNDELRKAAMESLRQNGIEADGDTYCIGTFDNDTMAFTEDIRVVKERIIRACVIFADASGVINLSKDEINTGDFGGDHIETGHGEDEDNYSGNFDLKGIIETIEGSEFTFSREIIRDIHLNLTSLNDKHFVILNGISGTGKTQLSRLYANAVYGRSYEEQNPYLRIIPVRPDWTDSTSLFGYYSGMQKRYVMTEFLETVLSAMKEREKPHFVVLDEMNLARVEYYFSDYLSAVESRKPIRLHSEEGLEDIPKEIIIPPNLYIIGTVNIDETTYAISDKVLDRAFVMTLSDVDLEKYWGSKEESFRSGLSEEYETLNELHTILMPYDLHFGYRSMEEMISKLNANRSLSEDLMLERKAALDRVVCGKVLPKIRGDERIQGLLDALLKWAEKHFGLNSATEKHLTRMKGELERYGAAQFWR